MTPKEFENFRQLYEEMILRARNWENDFPDMDVEFANRTVKANLYIQLMSRYATFEEIPQYLRDHDDITSQSFRQVIDRMKMYATKYNGIGILRNEEDEKTISDVDRAFFSRMKDDLKDASTWFNSEQYDNLVGTLERIDDFFKEHPDYIDGDEVEYQDLLTELNENVKLYLTHKVELGTNENAVKKVNIAFALKNYINERGIERDQYVAASEEMIRIQENAKNFPEDYLEKAKARAYYALSEYSKTAETKKANGLEKSAKYFARAERNLWKHKDRFDVDELIANVRAEHDDPNQIKVAVDEAVQEEVREEVKEEVREQKKEEIKEDVKEEINQEIQEEVKEFHHADAAMKDTYAFLDALYNMDYKMEECRNYLQKAAVKGNETQILDNMQDYIANVIARKDLLIFGESKLSLATYEQMYDYRKMAHNYASDLLGENALNDDLKALIRSAHGPIMVEDVFQVYEQHKAEIEFLNKPEKLVIEGAAQKKEYIKDTLAYKGGMAFLEKEMKNNEEYLEDYDIDEIKTLSDEDLQDKLDDIVKHFSSYIAADIVSDELIQLREKEFTLREVDSLEKKQARFKKLQTALMGSKELKDFVKEQVNHTTGELNVKNLCTIYRKQYPEKHKLMEDCYQSREAYETLRKVLYVTKAQARQVKDGLDEDILAKFLAARIALTRFAKLKKENITEGGIKELDKMLTDKVYKAESQEIKKSEAFRKLVGGYQPEKGFAEDLLGLFTTYSDMVLGKKPVEQAKNHQQDGMQKQGENKQQGTQQLAK